MALAGRVTDEPQGRGFVRADVRRTPAGLECVIERDDDVTPPAHLEAVGVIAETALRMLRDHGASPELLERAVRASLR